MNRRNFLTAALTTTAAGLLIPKHTPGVEEFAAAQGESIALVRPHVEHGIVDASDMFVYNKEGRPIGIIADIRVDQPKIDVTPLGASERQYMPGLRRVELTVVVSGQISVAVGRDGKTYRHAIDPHGLNY
jgi:thiamine biosynthesis lipoprotein ApbE